jgi:hypothetical protein
MELKITDVIVRDDLYPRLQHEQSRAQQYSEITDLLPPIEVNQNNELIDGKHRLVAHRLAEKETIPVEVTQTRSDVELLALAIKRNASHGLQLQSKDKKKLALRLYLDEASWQTFSSASDRASVKKDIATLLSCSEKLVREATSEADQRMREERREKVKELYLQAYTTEEIGEQVGLSGGQLKTEVSSVLEALPKQTKVQFSDDFDPPIYNVWTFGKKSNKTSHPGNTEQRIVENLLWAYTEPLDLIVDPFAGGGSTLDVCRNRGRRCWMSDRKPQPGLEDKVRQMDITEEMPPLYKRWSEVSLVYLDPPYWKQVAGEYSDDPQDLANYESADEFHDTLSKIVIGFSKKMKAGSHIALIIQPTQWRAPEKQFTDHVIETIKRVGNKKLTVENRVSCPYSTEQCTPQMVEWAKKNKQFLVLSRELIIWKVLD